MRTQMQCWKSQRDELGGSGMGHYVIPEWWSQRGIKMFQTNITPMHSAGVMHCSSMCACLPALLNKWGGEGKNRTCASVFWVCLMCVSGLVSESVVPVCHCLRGPWVCECCCSSSPPLSFLSLLPLLGPAQHLLLGQGRVPKQLKATWGVHEVFVCVPYLFFMLKLKHKQNYIRRLHILPDWDSSSQSCYCKCLTMLVCALQPCLCVTTDQSLQKKSMIICCFRAC